MDHDLRMERRRVRLFFAGLLVISAALDIVGALLVHRQTRSEVLETLLPATVTLGGRAGALLSGVSLLLLAVGIARGKRIAFRLTVAVLIATIAFELVVCLHQNQRIDELLAAASQARPRAEALRAFAMRCIGPDEERPADAAELVRALP